MPQIQIRVFREANGELPVCDCLGHELRRPLAAPLRDGIHELRIRIDTVQYRVLYYFHGRNVAVLSHGIRKPSAKVPDYEIEKAIRNLALVESNPEKHTADFEI